MKLLTIILCLACTTQLFSMEKLEDDVIAATTRAALGNALGQDNNLLQTAASAALGEALGINLSATDAHSQITQALGAGKLASLKQILGQAANPDELYTFSKGQVKGAIVASPFSTKKQQAFLLLGLSSIGLGAYPILRPVTAAIAQQSIVPLINDPFTLLKALGAIYFGIQQIYKGFTDEEGTKRLLALKAAEGVARKAKIAKLLEKAQTDANNALRARDAEIALLGTQITDLRKQRDELTKNLEATIKKLQKTTTLGVDEVKHDAHSVEILAGSVASTIGSLASSAAEITGSVLTSKHPGGHSRGASPKPGRH